MQVVKQDDAAHNGLRLASVVLRVLLLSPLWLLGACGSDNNPNGSALVDMNTMVAMLPDNTRGVMTVEIAELLAGEASAGFSGWLSGETANAPFDAQFQLIRRYCAGMDPASAIQQVLLAQTLDSEQGFILVAHVRAQAISDIFDPALLSRLDTYKGQEIFASVDTGLQLSLLAGSRLVIGSESALRSVIDTFKGDAPAVAGGELGPYLAMLAEGFPLSFIYALPGLYREVVPPGSGAASLQQAQLVAGRFSFAADSFTGTASIVSDNAEQYVSRFKQLAAEAEAVRLSVSDSGSIDIAIPDTPYSQTANQHLLALGLFKALVHDMDAVDYADEIAHGANVPWMNFKVGGEPNSIFINFEFKDAAQIAAFEANELPAGFTLAPIRILDTDAPTFFLVLNVYQSSGGLVSGARAEWSVFVNDPEGGHPRFLVVQAAASDISADPVNLLTLPEPVIHQLVAGKILSYVGVKDANGLIESNYFTSRITWPQQNEIRVGFTREFVAANDFIYWGNGVADRGLYNASVHNREGVRIPDGEIEILDESRWANYIKATPKHSYVYLNPLDIVVSPWWNLDAGYLDVSSSWRQQLIDFKNGFYPATLQAIAAAAVAGAGDALAAFSVGKTVPSSWFHFRIVDPAGLESALALPQASRLAKIRLLEDDINEDFYLGLRVYQVDDAPSGKRAEWMVYVADDNGRPYTLLLDMLTEEAVADPLDWLRLPSVVAHQSVNGEVTTRLASASIVFDASGFSTSGRVVSPSLDWVETGDRVCRLNGVCDKFFYDGQTMEVPLFVIAPSAVNIWSLSTPWDAFITAQPASVFVRDNVQVYATNPWHNIPQGVQ